MDQLELGTGLGVMKTDPMLDPFSVPVTSMATIATTE